MNDFGVFNAMQDVIRTDPVLLKKISAIVTEVRPGMQPPYLVMHFEGVTLDIPCYVQTALVGCEMNVISAYHGDQELHELMSRINALLDGASLPVQIDAMGLQGVGMVKLIEQARKYENGCRIGKITYQIRITIRRD